MEIQKKHETTLKGNVPEQNLYFFYKQNFTKKLSLRDLLSK